MLQKITVNNFRRGIQNPSLVAKFLSRQLKGTSNKNKLKTHIKSKQSRGALAGNFSTSTHPIAVYFSGNINQWYQISTWFKAFSELNKHSPIMFVVRNREVFNRLINETEFLTAYCLTIDDVISLYEKSDFKVILYVNHGAKNFQSLINNNTLHIHINHGESDKLSTITNQANAYDNVFIVGEAAYERYQNNLIRKDMSRFKVIGRPQLENLEPVEFSYITNQLQRKANLSEEYQQRIYDGKKIILYAPTWEGTHDSMNYSSIPVMGIDIINKLLNNDDYIVIYKPHPHTGSRDYKTHKAHEGIISLINNSYNGIYLNDIDVINLYPLTNIAIFDNSTVAIDYLVFDKPMILTDLFDRIVGRLDRPRIIEAAKLIQQKDARNLISIIEDQINNDKIAKNRNKIKTHYLGNFNYSEGESTLSFIQEVKNVIKERDRLFAELHQNNNIGK